MLALIMWVFMLIIYIVFFYFGLMFYIIKMIFKFIISIFSISKIKKLKDIRNEEKKVYYDAARTNFTEKYLNPIATTYQELEKYKSTYEPIIKTKQKIKLVKPSDIQYKMTSEKIEELYKEQGFNVKVIDIVNNKYDTEYEVIFSKDTTQYDILLISGKIKDEFNIDGVNIKGANNKPNRLYITIPYECKVDE